MRLEVDFPAIEVWYASPRNYSEPGTGKDVDVVTHEFPPVRHNSVIFNKLTRPAAKPPRRSHKALFRTNSLCRNGSFPKSALCLGGSTPASDNSQLSFRLHTVPSRSRCAASRLVRKTRCDFCDMRGSRLRFAACES